MNGTERLKFSQKNLKALLEMFKKCAQLSNKKFQT